jgi:hypothetical protein
MAKVRRRHSECQPEAEWGIADEPVTRSEEEKEIEEENFY